MTRYVATINTPGYMPMDDDPPVFDSIPDAWSYLVDERTREEDSSAMVEEDPSDDYSEGWYAIQAHAAWHRNPMHVCDPAECLGTVYAGTPGYDGDHDLGLAYSVEIAEEEN